MRRLLVIASLALLGASLASPARADLVMHNQTKTATMRLLASTCSQAETVALLKEEWRDKFKNLHIESSTGVIRFYGCWYRTEEDDIVVVLSDGATMRFPASSFTESAI